MHGLLLKKVRIADKQGSGQTGKDQTPLLIILIIIRADVFHSTTRWRFALARGTTSVETAAGQSKKSRGAIEP